MKDENHRLVLLESIAFARQPLHILLIICKLQKLVNGCTAHVMMIVEVGNGQGNYSAIKEVHDKMTRLVFLFSFFLFSSVLANIFPQSIFQKGLNFQKPT